MSAPKYPTTLDNDPPILEDGSDDIQGEAFAFNSEIAEVLQAFIQPSSGSTVQELQLGTDKKSFVNLTGLLLASCRIQTGVSSTPDEWIGTTGTGVHTCFIPFQEGKFTEPPFVLAQGFVDYDEDPIANLLSIQIDRVTKSGCRYSTGPHDDPFKFFWMAIQPPWGWKTSPGDGRHHAEPSIVENDPTEVAWITHG